MAYSRISARLGNIVNLNACILQGGQPTDPFALYRVEIYQGSVCPENIVEAIDIDDPDSSSYPSPLIRGDDLSDGSVSSGPGKYTLPWSVPTDLVAPSVYWDVWYWYGTDPRNGSTQPLSTFTNQLIKFCNRFWIYPDNWFLDSGLQTVEFGFEPLNAKFNKPEIRPLEIGLMPLPLYDYDFNLVTPLIPYLQATITVKTENDELVIFNQFMTIKIRQGSYRSNPFVFSYLLDTSTLYIGTYQYRIMLVLPDNSTRVSQNFFFSIG